MKKYFTVLAIVCALQAGAQTPEWYYIRPGKTGVAGDYHHTITGDRFGNIWTGGYLPFWSDGSVVRFDDSVFTCWGNYDGYLPNDRVNAIAFDKEDRLWVGTDQGLASYDGTDWTQFTSGNSPLIYDQVIDMALDSNNYIWATLSEFGQIGDGGVGYYDGADWVMYTSSNSNLPTQVVSGIAVDAQNNKWIGCNMGLIKHDGLNWILYTAANSDLTNSSASDVQVDSLNRVWACTGSAIDIFDGISWTHINSSNSPMSGGNYTNFYTRGDKVIICETTGSSRIHIYNNGTWSTFIGSNHIYDSYIDEEGNFWYCGIGVVSKYDGFTWTEYTRYNTGLAEYFNEDVFVDSKNRKWFANGNGGVQVFDCPKWESYGPWNGGLFPIPQTFSTIGTATTEDSHGDIWFTYDGVYGYAVQIPEGDYKDYGSWTVWDMTNVSPLFQGPQEADADDAGKVYLRLYSDAIAVFDHATNSWELWDANNSGLAATPVYCMAPEPGGIMWFGQFGYLTKYDNGVWTSIELSMTPVGGLVNYINDIDFDDSGNMWLATDHGVWKYDGLNWLNWDESNSGLADDYVGCIETGNGDTVYVGAYDIQTYPYHGGISIFDGATWISFQQGSSPLPHKQVEDLALDNLGNLWILCQSEGFAVYRKGGVKGFECIDTNLQTGAIGSTVNEAMQPESAFSVYPNPFSTAATLSFHLDKAGKISIEWLDVSGKIIRQISSSPYSSGNHTVSLNADGLLPGLYLCKVISEEKTLTKKIIVQ